MDNTTSQLTSHVLSNKFSSFRFAHLHHSSFSASTGSLKFLNAQQQQTWRKLLYLTFRQGKRVAYSDLTASFGSTKKSTYISAWNSLTQKDLFIVTFDMARLLGSVTSKQDRMNDIHSISLYGGRRLQSASKYVIWIGCSHSANPVVDTAALSFNAVQASTLLLPNHTSQLCIYSSHKGLANLLGNISHCKYSRLTMHIDRFYQFLDNQTINPGVGVIGRWGLHEPPVKRRWVDFGNSDHGPQDLSPPMTRHKLDPLGRKRFLYSSLVFITKKLPESNTTNGVWGPFTITSWIGILAAYTVTAMVFAIIKIITVNNLENSWYECIFNQLLSLVSDERDLLPQPEKMVRPASSFSIGIDMVDENDNKLFMHSEKSFMNTTQFINVKDELSEHNLFEPKISVNPFVATERGASSIRDESHVTPMKFNCYQSRGRISKSILYGTIRVVSFVLLAMYEGKLYNSITFPKSKLPATFDELISNDKYFIKVSSEAAKLENITSRIKGNTTFEQLPLGFDKQNLSPNRSVSAASDGIPLSGKFAESVNILDCVNWVESGPDPNHACVGYEFELRNLHKAQKSDKILIRSKQRLLKFGSTGRASVVMTGSSHSSTTASMRYLNRRRGFTLFPGGFQISKWILESGILQLWSIVENAFMESVINPSWSDPFKVFTIRDYLGLFVVYFMLLIFASIMFILEHIVTVLKKLAKSKKARKTVRWLRVKCNQMTCRPKTKCYRFHAHGNLWSKSRLSCNRVQTHGKRTGRFLEFDRWRGRKYFRDWSSVNKNLV